MSIRGEERRSEVERGATFGLPRFVPAAVTPLRYGDIAEATVDHVRGRGREEFARALADYLGVSRCHTYTSFMRAIYACLSRISDVDGGDAVILPRYSCPSFAHGVLAAGLDVRYCDQDPRTLTIDTDHLRTLATDDALALVCVNHFGLANPMSEIAEFCRDEDLRLVEDLGYGLGSEYEGRRLGSFGEFSVLNFQEGKAIPVGGGMVAREGDDPVAFDADRPAAPPNLHVMLGYRFFSEPTAYRGFVAASNALDTNVRKRLSMEDTIQETAGEYDFSFDPTDPLATVSNFQGALGTRVLDRMDDHRAIRARNAEMLASGVADATHVRSVEELPGLTGGHYIRYPVLVDRGHRDAIERRLADAGIEASSMYTEHGIDVDPDAYPGAAEIADRLLTLPCHPKADERDVERTIRVLRSYDG